MHLQRSVADHKQCIKPAQTGSGNVRTRQSGRGEKFMSIRTTRIGHRAALCRSALAVAILSLPAAAHAQGTDQPAQTGESDGEADTEIVVTGTSIRGIPPTGSGLISISREDARQIGAASTPELLATVPQLNSFNTAPRVSNGGLGSFAPGLRGLPSAATLPLMNGHRPIFRRRPSDCSPVPALARSGRSARPTWASMRCWTAGGRPDPRR
jgi:hypothetical protein